MIGSSIAIALGFVSAIIAGNAHEVVSIPQPAVFTHWTVACDNVRHCEAIAGSVSAGSGDEWTIRVTRGAQPNAVPEVEAFPIFADAMESSHLRIDGRKASFQFDGDGQLVGDANGFLRAIARARKAEVIAPNGQIIGTLPVDGASAAFRWIDDKQRRVGTETAIVAIGWRPASTVPGSPPLPRIAQPAMSAAPPRMLSPSDVRTIRSLGDGCEENPPDDFPLGVETYRLDATHTVGIVGCFLGAYQGPSVIVVINEDGSWKLASIELPDAMAQHSLGTPWQHMLTSAGYSSKQRLLTEWAKGRGLGDCGRSASWAWDGSYFRLTAFRALNECRGAQPESWPSLWQTANDPVAKAE